MTFWKKKPLVAPTRPEYQKMLLEALLESIGSTERFAMFAETTADSARLINDIFNDEDPDDPHKLLEVDNFVTDLPISRPPESEMYVFLTYALHVATAYCNTIIPEPPETWVPQTQQTFYPQGKLHELQISKDTFEAFYIYGDDAMRRTGKTHNINRQELQFAAMCITYTLLATYSAATNQPITETINKFEKDLAQPGPTFIKILGLPQKQKKS